MSALHDLEGKPGQSAWTIGTSQALGLCQHSPGFGQFLSEDRRGGDLPAPDGPLWCPELVLI